MTVGSDSPDRRSLEESDPVEAIRVLKASLAEKERRRRKALELAERYHTEIASLTETLGVVLTRNPDAAEKVLAE